MKYRICQVLDSEGEQCRKKARGTFEYLGHSEIYSWFDNKPQWVKVYMCQQHLDTLK